MSNIYRSALDPRDAEIAFLRAKLEVAERTLANVQPVNPPLRQRIVIRIIEFIAGVESGTYFMIMSRMGAAMVRSYQLHNVLERAKIAEDKAKDLSDELAKLKKASIARIEKKESMIAYLSGMEARDLRSQLLVDKANLLDETESNEDTKP